MENINDLNDTVNPKSVQLNFDDLAITQSMTIKVTGIKRGTKEQPLAIEFEGMEGRPYKPCLTMRRALISAWGADGRNWVGKSIKLYADPSVKFGGAVVGGIRISALSHIEKPIKLLLSTSKAKRAEIIINKLQSYPDKEFEDKHPQWIAAIWQGKITLQEVIQKAATLTDEQINILKKGLENERPLE